jgi:predicted component of type VI protein secretion system
MKDKLYPVDLGHLRDKAVSVRESLDIFVESSLSEEFKAFHLKSARQVADSIVRDIDWLLDTKLFNGQEAMGLDELRNEIASKGEQST